MLRKALRPLRTFFAVLGFLVLLAGLIYQVLPAKEREKVNLVFIQAYSVLNEGGKPQEVYSFHTQFFSWDAELREELPKAYPLSEEGLALLSQVRFGRIPFNHYSHGYARPFAREVWTAVSRPQLSFHEFSHVAFANLVVGEEENYGATIQRLQGALLEAFTNPQYRSIFTVCYESRRDLGAFGADPEHVFLAILEWSGGNLSLVPEPLRDFAPWIKEGEIKSWDQLAELYLRSLVPGREVLELHYGEDNPLWQCADSELWSSEFADNLFDQPDPWISYTPSASERVFLRAEEREILWFWAVQKEGAFSFWEKYFTREFERYRGDLVRRLVVRHAQLLGDFPFRKDLYPFIYEFFEEGFRRFIREPHRLFYFIHPSQDIPFEARAWVFSSLNSDADYLSDYLFRRFRRSYQGDRGFEFPEKLEYFLEGLEQGRIAPPSKITTFRLQISSRDRLGFELVEVRYCLFWEGEEGVVYNHLYNDITVRYSIEFDSQDYNFQPISSEIGFSFLCDRE